MVGFCVLEKIATDRFGILYAPVRLSYILCIQHTIVQGTVFRYKSVITTPCFHLLLEQRFMAMYLR